MNKSYRICLVCRQLFKPISKNTSYCELHKPKDTRHRVHNKAYDDAEYRRNRKKIKELQKECQWCQTRGSSQNKLVCDHIIPLSRGGSHHIDNLRILCMQCHNKRQGRDHR